MDNLTHSLVGAIIGQMGLKRKSGLAMPTLIIAANIPDIDAVAALLGGHEHLALRRGITHGPIAMLILPIVLWAAMLWFDGWQTRRGKRPEKRLPIHKGWLLALAYIGCFSHPLFDWFNSYGVRLLEPFSSQWFYGDTLFIIDIWIWAALCLGLWFSMRGERAGRPDWTRIARTASLVALAYIVVNFAISTAAEKVTDNILRARGAAGNRVVVANPVPVAFWQREMLWRNGTRYGDGHYSLLGGVSLNETSTRQDAAARAYAGNSLEDPDVRAFMFWSRMPIFLFEKDELVLTDQRFASSPVSDRFRVTIEGR